MILEVAPPLEYETCKYHGVLLPLLDYDKQHSLLENYTIESEHIPIR